MSKLLTPYAYVMANLKAERMSEFNTVVISGRHYITDRDHMPLNCNGYASRDAMFDARSKIIAKASRAYWKKVA